MRIQHNIAALNSHRQLTSNNSAVSKNLEKLSSGYKINRAGDDAAGLAISEKMRAQITGLETAQKNANDGISLIQTAEGALTEVHSMLNRMVELTEQSANGTYQDAVDRENLQKEMNSLRDEIDRISEGTNFNGINLLDGSLGGTKDGDTKSVGGAEVTISGAKEGVQVVFAKATTAGNVGAAWSGNTLTVTVSSSNNAIKQADIDALIAGASGAPDNAKGLKVKVDGSINGTSLASTTLTVAKAKQAEVESAAITNQEGQSTKIKVTAQKSGDVTSSLTINSGGTLGATKQDGGDITLNLDSSKSYSASELNSLIRDAGGEMTVSYEGTISTADLAGAGALTLAGGEGAKGGAGLELQIGDTADSFNQLTVSVGSMSSTSLGLSGVDISTQSGAKAALQTIKDAINTVSSTRGDLGALQNRLEHTINNLSVTAENMTAAESRIRDVDMAQEMMEFTKNNILTQASQAMLAQANQLPQGVLQLLQ